MGSLENSIEDFKRALETRTEKATCYNNLGLSHFENEEFDEAILDFDKAI